MSQYVPKIKFSNEDDVKLKSIVEKIGTKNWNLVSQEMKTRTPRQCRERWINYLSPNLSNDDWTIEEDKLLDELFKKFGSRWHKIAHHFPNRSGNCVRNRYKLRIRRLARSNFYQKGPDEIEIKEEKKKNITNFIKIPFPDPNEELFNLFSRDNSEFRTFFNFPLY